MSLGKTLNVDFLTVTFCGVEDKSRCRFDHGKYRRKEMYQINIFVSLKVVLGNNSPMLNVYDVVRRINKFN